MHKSLIQQVFQMLARAPKLSQQNLMHSSKTHGIYLHNYIQHDALPSPGLNPLEGPTMLSCGKLELGRRSQLPTLERGRGAC